MEQRIVHKFSVVYISSGEKTQVFQSIEDVPEELRRQIARNAKNTQVETLVIANERGRELIESKNAPVSKPAERTGWKLTPALKWSLLGLLVGGSGLVVTLAWNFR